MTADFASARDERGKLIRPKDESWREATSVEDVLARWPERVDLLLSALDLERSGLEVVKAAVAAGDKAQACRALLAYYADEGLCRWILERLPEPRDRHVEIAGDILERRHRKGRTVGTIPVRAGGAWDWNYTGPKGDREFAFNLNRHPFLDDLLQAWRKTGDEKYARAFDRIIRDWVLHTVYPGEEHQYVWTWRVLEAGLRMRQWLPAFHGFAEAEGFTPAGRLLMLSSFVQHARYIKMHHWSRHNHALMELDGLNRLALALPELKQADAWSGYALEEMLDELDHQVYPDGAHDELSSGYHWVSLHSFEQVAAVCRAAGRAVPDEYRKRLVDMYDYWAGLVRPDGSLPQNNRSDRSDPTRRILAAAERYDRPDWRYIVTNGREGEKPDGLPSRFAPWAGHLTSRSSWQADALWSFFDAGPAGAGSVHADSLHLSVTGYGKDFLIDSGRFWYMGDKWQRFAHSSRAHNVILIDRCDQQAKPRKTDAPRARAHWGITETFDFARATHAHYKGLEGEAAHTRIVVFLKEAGCWVVLDRITTDRPREITPMWRFRPERQVKTDDAGNLLTADAEGANLAITPVGDIAWEVELIRGREHPHLQGWYSEVTTEWEPNTCAALRGRIDGDAVFAWVILPVESGPARPAGDVDFDIDGAAAVIRFAGADDATVHLRVPLERGAPKIVSERPEGGAE
ncbi:MAG: heparinase II/III family protein [Planctomycetota bacterium]